MVRIGTEHMDFEEREQELFRLLDRGIEDVENQKIIPHEEAMEIVRERLKLYEV